MTTNDNLLYLIKKLRIDINKLKNNSEEGFDGRIKLQKIVFLSKRLGVNFNYDYSLYLHGPYSSVLSKDYYSISEDEVKNAPSLEKIDKHIIKIEELYKKDTLWLEVAATILDIKDSNQHLNWNYILSHVNKIKSDILQREGKTLEYLESVLEDLKREQLIQTEESGN
ncbi:MAG: hypothetical protein ACYDAO_08500 [Thermoplasmataceae archaeon]